MASAIGDDIEAAFAAEVDTLPASVDRAAVKRMQTVAWILDDGIRIPGSDRRIGIDPLIGVIPIAGDVVAGGISLYIILEAARLGVTYRTILRMLGNVAVDVVAGSVPYLGDIFDAAWKANKRNVELAIKDLSR